MYRMRQGEKIRVAFVDISKIYGTGLRVQLKKCAGIAVVGETKSNKDLLRLVVQKKVDILLLDTTNPVSNTQYRVVFDILKMHPYIRIIILSNDVGEQFLREGLDQSVRGYIVKDIDGNIIEAIKKVFSGDTYYSPSILAKFKQALLLQKSGKTQQDLPTFSKTEKAIIEYICSEMTNKDIADKLFLSVRTVEGYRTKILRKIQAKGTAGIVIQAIKRGLVQLDTL